MITNEERYKQEDEQNVINSGLFFGGALTGVAIGITAPALVGIAAPLMVCCGIGAIVNAISIPPYLLRKLKNKG